MQQVSLEKYKDEFANKNGKMIRLKIIWDAESEMAVTKNVVYPEVLLSVDE